MNKYSKHFLSILLMFGFFAFFASITFAGTPREATVSLGWSVPGFGAILGFIIRLFFTVAGLAALFFLLIGALKWVASGGNKEKVEEAREQIVQAVIGAILIVIVLSVMVILEQIIFNGQICFGISCPLRINGLVGT